MHVLPNTERQRWPVGRRISERPRYAKAAGCITEAPQLGIVEKKESGRTDAPHFTLYILCKWCTGRVTFKKENGGNSTWLV